MQLCLHSPGDQRHDNPMTSSVGNSAAFSVEVKLDSLMLWPSGCSKPTGVSVLRVIGGWLYCFHEYA